MIFEDREDFFNNKKWILIEEKSTGLIAAALVLVDKKVDKF